MKESPSISVVICAKNDARFIGETLDSVFQQNYPWVEVHVQDGGSTDGTLEILRNYPVRWTSEADKGVPDALNRGSLATRGEFLIFLGADDPLAPGALQVLGDTLKADPDLGFAYGDIEYIDAFGKPFDLLKGKPLDLDDLFWGNHVSTQSVLMRRTALESVGGYRLGLLNADWDLWLRLGSRFRSAYIPKVLAKYRVHGSSLTVRNYGAFARSVRFVADTLLDDPHVVSKLKWGRARATAGSSLLTAAFLVLAGERGEAWDCYREAVRSYLPALWSRRGASALLALLAGPGLYYRIRNRGWAGR